MISALANCGIRLRSEAAYGAVVSEFAGEPPNYDLLLALVGDVPFDPDTFEGLAPHSDDVWHFDYEAIEDHGAYKSIVENCARISSGDLRFDEVSDFVDVESGVAWVEVIAGGGKDRMNLRVDNDWTDPAIFDHLNHRLNSAGSERRLAQHGLGQDVLMICKSPGQIADINKLTGLRFEIHFQ